MFRNENGMNNVNDKGKNTNEKQWLNLSLGCFKIKCYALFLNACFVLPKV